MTSQERIAPELRAELERYARHRAELVRRAGISVSADYARELVDDVWADTLIGLASRDPGRELLEQMKNAVRRRTWLEIRRAYRISLVPLHEAAEAEMPTQELGSRSALLTSVSAAVCQELWPLISRDIDVRAIMVSWMSGIVERIEVMQLTGLSESAYGSARRRLRLMLRDLTPELRQVALDLLRT